MSSASVSSKGSVVTWTNNGELDTVFGVYGDVA